MDFTNFIHGPSLIILSALLHATWNAMLKHQESKRQAIFWIFLISALLTTAISFKPTLHLLDANSGLYWSIAAGLAEAAYASCLVLSLDRGDLGTNYSLIRGVAMILVWCCSTMFLDEKINLLIGFGALMILVGIVLNSWVVRGRNQQNATLFVYLAAASIASANLCYAKAQRDGVDALPLFAISTWTALPFLAWFGKRHFNFSLREIKNSHWVRLTIAGALCAFSFILFLQGMAVSGPGFATSLRNSSVFFAQVLALFLGEKVAKRQWVGATLIALGAALLAYYK